MKKTILSILIISIFFTIGIAVSQEKEISEEEKAKLRRMGKELELIMKAEEKLKKIISINEEIKRLKKELNEIEEQLEENYIDDEIENEMAEIDKRSEYKTAQQIADEIIESEEEDLLTKLKKDSLPETEFEWLKDLPPYLANKMALESEFDAGYLKKIKEENDRLEDLIWDLKRIKDDIDMARWGLEFAKPDPSDFMEAYDMFKSSMQYDLWLYLWLNKK